MSWGFGIYTHTNLRPDQLSQTPDILRCGVDAEGNGFRVDDLADAEPESGFQTL